MSSQQTAADMIVQNARVILNVVACGAVVLLIVLLQAL